MHTLAITFRSHYQLPLFCLLLLVLLPVFLRGNNQEQLEQSAVETPYLHNTGNLTEDIHVISYVTI